MDIIDILPAQDRFIRADELLAPLDEDFPDLVYNLSVLWVKSPPKQGASAFLLD